MSLKETILSICDAVTMSKRHVFVTIRASSGVAKNIFVLVIIAANVRHFPALRSAIATEQLTLPYVQFYEPFLPLL